MIRNYEVRLITCGAKLLLKNLFLLEKCPEHLFLGLTDSKLNSAPESQIVGLPITNTTTSFELHFFR